MAPSRAQVTRIPVQREYGFQAAHMLPCVRKGHKCRTMHGHSYRLLLEVEGPVQASGYEMGMVVDFEVMDAAWERLKRTIDHKTLNGVHVNPTVENLTPLFWRYFAKALSRPAAKRRVEWRLTVTLHEGPQTMCRYSGP